jgi:hypothetical protein
MVNIEQIVRKVLNETYNPKSMVIVEDIKTSSNLDYHIKNNLTISENIFRPYSDSYFNLVCEVRELYNNGSIDLPKNDLWLIETDLGNVVKLTNGEYVSLDCPYLIEDNELLSEAEYQGKKVKVGYPMRDSGGKKKYKVYVKNPSTGNIKKITFGDVHGGLTAKVSNPKARKSFAARHKCKDKKDRTKAGYWSCRINRYGHLWGGKTYGGYW